MRKIKIGQDVKDKRAKYPGESRNEAFQLGRVSNGDLARLNDAHGRIGMATPALGNNPLSRDYEAFEEARANKRFVQRTMTPKQSSTGQGKLQTYVPESRMVR